MKKAIAVLVLAAGWLPLAAQAPLPEATVTAVAAPQQDGRVRLGERVTVTVANAERLRADAASAGKPITLYLNGQDTGIEPTDAATSALVFRLERTSENKGLWSRLLREPFYEPVATIHPSVGIAGDKPLRFVPRPVAPKPGAPKSSAAPRAASTLRLVKVEVNAWGWFWLAVLAVTVVAFFLLVKRTDLLRNGPPLGADRQPYSLGRSQMAWWFFLVIVAYVLIWLITGDRDTVPTSMLVLMGISAATAFGAVAIDATASSRIETALKRLDDEKVALVTRQAALGAAAPPDLAAALQARLDAIDREQAVAVRSPGTKSWLIDVLTDDNGAVALHRFQVLLWTFVLGAVFFGSILHALTMPDFPPTLLALMGISATTYLGFKLPAGG